MTQNVVPWVFSWLPQVPAGHLTLKDLRCLCADVQKKEVWFWVVWSGLGYRFPHARATCGISWLKHKQLSVLGWKEAELCVLLFSKPQFPTVSDVLEGKGTPPLPVFHSSCLLSSEKMMVRVETENNFLLALQKSQNFYFTLKYRLRLNKHTSVY